MAAVLSGAVALAQDASPGAPVDAEWLNAWIARYSEAEYEPPIHVAYTLTIQCSLTPAEIEAIRAEIAGDPNHPLRREHQSNLRLADEGPEVTHRGVWVGSGREVRETTDYSEGFITPFGDHGVSSDGVVWSLSPSQRHIDDKRDSGTRATNARAGVARFVGTGMRRGPLGLRAVSVSGERDAWEAVVESAGATRRFKWSGSTLATGEPFLTEAEVVWDNAGEFVGHSTRHSEVAARELSGRLWPVAHRVETLASNGMLERTYALTEVREISAERLREVTRVPSFRVPDPIRGDIGEVTSAAGEEKTVDPGAASPRPGASGMVIMVVGAVLGTIALVGALVVWRLMRR